MAARLIALRIAALGLLLASLAQAGGRVVVFEHRPSEMVEIPAGTFLMGFGAAVLALPESAEEERIDRMRATELHATQECQKDFGEELAVYCTAEGIWQSALPHRTVHVDRFEIDRYEVTTADYRKCVAAGVCGVAPLVSGDTRYLRDQWPMVNVNWFDAKTYCQWRGKRLPTEAEWEKAARGTDGRRWPWGSYYRRGGGNLGKLDSLAMRTLNSPRPPLPLDTSVGDARDGYRTLARPGTLPWGKTPYGVQNMIGNVAEWTADYYTGTGYADLPDINPVRRVPRVAGETNRTVRGGSWLRVPSLSRPYYRLPMAADQRRIDVGFRCARQ
ncbi:MAG: formylglycine-generating enzyme family protein [Deltaproteobacteria bacterium]|nr:formylglycine-generating enzyme family protein [Deltaproteobacteria bacterium]